MGPVQFSWRRGVAKNSFAKLGFWGIFCCQFYPGKTAKHRVHSIFFSPDPRNLLNQIFRDWPRSDEFWRTLILLYTPTRKDHIHKFQFRNSFPEKLHISYINIFFWNWFPEIYITRIRLWLRELHGQNVWELFSREISFQLHYIMCLELISQCFPTGVSAGPFRTKNTMALESAVFCCRRSVLQSIVRVFLLFICSFSQTEKQQFFGFVPVLQTNFWSSLEPAVSLFSIRFSCVFP